MAELVQEALEDMVPELEQMQRTNILSKKEVGLLRKKRQAHEYRLQRRNKRREDFLLYIQDEIALLDLIEVRREALRYQGKKSAIDYSVARRCNRLFRVLEHRFRDDERVWLSHVAFLERMGWQADVGKVFRGMLRFHMLKPQVWARAARFEWAGEVRDKDKQWENARKLLLEGLRFNPKSEDLLREYFWFELSHWQHLLKQEKSKSDEKLEKDGDVEEDDPVLRGEIVRKVFEEAVRNIREPGFICSLLKLASKFDACLSRKEGHFGIEDIKSVLLEQFEDCATVWDGHC